MIRIGLNEREKQRVINSYIQAHGIKKVFAFYHKKFPVALNVGIDYEYVEYSNIIMYKYFYRLLEEIDNSTLLVFDGCMRTQNRSELTYNCAHHYCNQTEHKIVFEYFPFIEDREDFMILLNFLNKGRYKVKSFDFSFLHDEDVQAKPQPLTIHTIDIPTTEKDLARYQKKKDALFDNLGNSDPDTIPRQLHVWAGNLKKPAIDPDGQYIARNGRFKLPNVATYRNVEPGNYAIIDFPYRRIDSNDFLKRTGMMDITFINTGLKVDLYYLGEMRAWIGRLGDFYAETSLYR